MSSPSSRDRLARDLKHRKKRGGPRPPSPQAMKILRQRDYDDIRVFAMEEVAGWRRYLCIAPQHLSAPEKNGQIGPTHGAISVEYGPRERMIEAHAPDVAYEYARAKAEPTLLDENGCIPRDVILALLDYGDAVSERSYQERRFLRKEMTPRPSFPCDCEACQRLW